MIETQATGLQSATLRRHQPPRVVPHGHYLLNDALTLLRRLRDAAALPRVTLQVLPAVAHNANASGFIVADDATAYAEHVAGGYVFTDEQTATSLPLPRRQELPGGR